MRVNLIRCLTFLMREFSWLEAEGSCHALRSFQIDAGRPFYGVLAWVCLFRWCVSDGRDFCSGWG